MKRWIILVAVLFAGGCMRTYVGMNEMHSTWQTYSVYINDHEINYSLPPAPAISELPKKYINFDNESLEFYHDDGCHIATIIRLHYGYYQGRWDGLSDVTVTFSVYSTEGKRQWIDLSEFTRHWYGVQVMHQQEILWTPSYWKEPGVVTRIGFNHWYHQLGYKPVTGPKVGLPDKITDEVNHESFVLLLDERHFLIVNFNYDNTHKRDGLEQRRMLAKRIIEEIRFVK